MRFESRASSGLRALLSNLTDTTLNGCTKIVQQLFPRRCVLCAAPVRHERICTGCSAELPRMPPGRCTVCAVPLASGAFCGACQQKPPAFERISAAFAYDFPVDALIHAFKYGRRLALAPVLGEMLAGCTAPEADLLMPMPLSRQRLYKRGFNQALEIARVLSRRYRLPLEATGCRKVVETAPKERAKNVRRAFVCDAPVTGLRIAVVDDVLTTGATLNELARVLLKAGAASVTGWVVARTLPR